MCVGFDWTQALRAAYIHATQASLLRVFLLQMCVKSMQLRAVPHVHVHACARVTRVYAKECGWVRGADGECACAIPPAGTIITARAHSRQLSPGGLWLRPAWRDAAWLTVEPGSAPPSPHTHVRACTNMMRARCALYLYYNVTVKMERACAPVDTL